LAAALPLPIALPLAFASHFVLDALPHYGIPHKHRDLSSVWKIFTGFDFILAWLFIGGLSLYLHRYDIFLCGLVAASPDFVWVYRIIRSKSYKLDSHHSKFSAWHAKIQRYERPWGIFIEVPLAILLFVSLYKAM
jgi:hypothetical protein